VCINEIETANIKNHIFEYLAELVISYVFSLYCLPSRNRFQILLSDSNENKNTRHAFGVGVGKIIQI